ncbi:MAG: hypothetical protein WCJ11_12135 [Methylococcaceae bacterium]
MYLVHRVIDTYKMLVFWLRARVIAVEKDGKVEQFVQLLPQNEGQIRPVLATGACNRLEVAYRQLNTRSFGYGRV